MGLHIRPGDKKALKFYNGYFGQLADATIVSAGMVQEAPDPEYPEFSGEEYWPTLTVKLKDGTLCQLELSQDEEGNGPGWLFGLPVPPEVSS